MTEIKGAQPKRRKLFGFLEVRLNRREYWLSVGFAVALAVALSAAGVDVGSTWVTVAVVFAQIRRLHDFGRTGWWAVAAQGAGLAVMMVVWLLVSMEVGVATGGVVMLAFLVWAGCVPSDPDENRFGKPQTGLFATA
jgi:uncharacterized membrane protein YhaH (DUF805 family)